MQERFNVRIDEKANKTSEGLYLVAVALYEQIKEKKNMAAYQGAYQAAYQSKQSEQSSKQSELGVITHAKNLCSYVMTVTDKSPKRFRFTLVAKLQGYALNTIEHLYRANEVFVQAGDAKKAALRLDYQHQALTELKLLGYMAQLAMEQGCILPKQYEQITKKAHDCQNMLGAWINSDRKRLGM